MSRTSPLSLVIATLVGAIIGFGVDAFLVGRGGSVYLVPWEFATLLAALAVITVVLGIGVRRSLQPKSRWRELRPRAVDVLRFVKTMAVAGAFEAGYLAGFLVYMLSRPIVPDYAVPSAVGTVIAAVMLVIAALVAERLCELPPPTDPDADASSGSGAPHSEPA